MLRCVLLFTVLLNGELALSEKPILLETAIKNEATNQKRSQDSQNKIDKLDDKTRQMKDELVTLSVQIRDLSNRKKELEALLINQERALETIATQEIDLAELQKRISPTLERMRTTLEKFVALDLPFLEKERKIRLKSLSALLHRKNVSVPEKFRRLMEAYQIELGYGYSVEATQQLISLNEHGSQLVELLRIGRLALLFRALDGSMVGYWNTAEETWVLLPRQFESQIAEGISIANRQIPTALFRVPLLFPKPTI